MRNKHQRFEEVFDALERERQRFDEDLSRLVLAAGYLRELLLDKRRTRHRRRVRCTPRRRQPA